MACEFLEKCAFYNDKMPVDSALGKLYKANYCESAKESCARYMVAKVVGREFVEPNLYPNMKERAQKIIAAHSK